MEFFQELLVTAAISLVVAFFLAKLISLASAEDLDQDLAESVISAVDLDQHPVSSEENGAQSMEVLKYEEEPRVPRSEGAVLMKGNETELLFNGQDDALVGETSGVTVKEDAEIVNDCGKDGLYEGDGVGLEGKSSENVESYRGWLKGGVEVESVCEFDRIGVKEGFGEGNGIVLADRLDEVNAGDLDLKEGKEGKKSESDGEFDLGLMKEEAKSNKGGFDIVNFARSDGDFAKEGEEEVELAENVVETERADEEKGSLLNDEDDWEGIERSELEKRFGAMASMFASWSGDVLSKIGSDVQMQLYGFHKVATEGPCYEPQPSVLKVSARAKWHAWQRLGSMNPEVAMEQYIDLLSGSICGCIGEKPENNNKRKEADDSLEEPVCGSKAPDLSSSPHHLMSSENERKQEEINPCVAKGDAIGGPEFLEQGTLSFRESG